MDGFQVCFCFLLIERRSGQVLIIVFSSLHELFALDFEKIVRAGTPCT